MSDHTGSLHDAPPVQKPAKRGIRLDVPLGAFQLTRLIGVGGMGEVWEGYHRAQSVPVAVKVITAARARDPRYREAFQNEVRAVAALDHPGVVVVFDYGEVDETAEEAAMGRLVAGSPFLAMELANGGSLRGQPCPSVWSDLKHTLLALLDILAHAHARGVIHRDLKPANVLVFNESGPRDTSARLRLTDFGLAHAMDRAEHGMRGTSGTPTYMAPEQFLGQWRDFGPWTDLYALGCMAYALAAGSPPFEAGGASGLRQAHLASDPPPLMPGLLVPEGFTRWIARLMAKEPLHRFRKAADAAYALELLGDVDESDDPPPPDRIRAVPASHTLEASVLEWNTALLVSDGRHPLMSGAPPAPDSAHLAERRLPPMPHDWRSPALERPSMQLVGAGLGLYGLRTVPIVDRDAERDAMWSHLAEARITGDARLLVLQGAAGTGKSRLAQWLGQRAQELGVATQVHAVHSSGGGPADGLPRLVQRALMAFGMSRQEMLRRAESWLRRRGVTDQYEWNALVELVWPATPADLRGGAKEIRFGSPEERYALIHRLLVHLATGVDDVDGRPAHRGAIVWLDDIQWGPDAMGLARYLLRNGHSQPCPILVVTTVQDEALQDRPVERSILASLLKEPNATRITVEPLGSGDRAMLVQELLGLEGELASQVEERTGGNPLFAVQLVGDWVQRGVLVVGPTGFVLRDGERAVVPDDIHAMWLTRIDRVLEQRPDTDRVGLELAALLGNEVDEVEWRGACSVAKVTVSSDLVQALIERRLAVVQPGGWTFAHGMLRESLARSAQEAGRAMELHDAAATTLQIRYEAARRPGLAERLGRHLHKAGRLDEALGPLQEAAAERRASSDYADALRLLDLRDEVMARLGVPVSDMRWGETWALRADLLIGQGRLDEAGDIALRIVDFGSRHGWTELSPIGLRHAGTVAAKRGRLDLAEQRLLEGRTIAQETGDEAETARSNLLLGDIARLRGDPEQALRRCRKALGQFAAVGDPRGQADVLLALSAACRVIGDLARTESYARQAIPLFERIGSRFGVASCENALGEVLRIRDDLAGAEASYRRAETLLRNVGSPEHRVPQLNLGLVLLARGEYAQARDVLTEVLEAFRRGGRRSLEGALHAFLLPCAAHALDWNAWRRHLESASQLLETSGFVDGDIAWAAHLGATLASEMGGNEEAIQALKLARVQWAALGTVEQVKSVDAEIARLQGITL